jgi:sugar/nucleoside kinase (ribokinase family)
MRPGADEASGGPVGVLVGLATLDLILGVERLPAPDEKVVATSQELSAGGPGATAAVAFAWAGGRPRLLTVLGTHPLARAVADDLRGHGVTLVDAEPEREAPPTVAAILRTTATGQRAVVSRTDRDVPSPTGVDATGSLLAGAGIVLADGHHLSLAEPVLRAARRAGIPVLLDAGSWRPAFATLLPLADVVVASAAFRPPAIAPEPDAILADLLARGVLVAARTDGPGPIRWRDAAGSAGSIDVEAVDVVDTLGAGDILHGVTAAVLATHAPGGPPATASVVQALVEGARVASASCASHGTRAWLEDRIAPPARPDRPS